MLNRPGLEAGAGAEPARAARRRPERVPATGLRLPLGATTGAAPGRVTGAAEAVGATPGSFASRRRIKPYGYCPDISSDEKPRPMPTRIMNRMPKPGLTRKAMTPIAMEIRASGRKLLQTIFNETTSPVRPG